MGARGHPGNSALPRICCCIADQQLRFVCGSAFYDRYIRSWLASVGAVGHPRLQRVDERNPAGASD